MSQPQNENMTESEFNRMVDEGNRGSPDLSNGIGTPLKPQPAGLRSPSSPNTNAQQITKAHLAIAEAYAMSLHENDKRKQDERKRKRDEEDKFYKQVRTKLEAERKRLDDGEQYSASSNKDLYALFNDLQGISHDFNIAFDTPELVVVGMQSDGKSSFIEALLGFQFNIVDSSIFSYTGCIVTFDPTDIGTRRPLIIQMISNPAKERPSCRFRKENAELTVDCWEENETHVEDLCEEIIRRTNNVAGRGDRVSSSPIILRVEYCHCSNLNIYDTPGFRIGGDEKLKNEISDMVRKLIEPKHRIIVCLEQSTVEWANTVSRPLVRQVDPDFSRTILVNTKFDNRVKELRGRDQAHKYLDGEGLPPNKRPFFVSLPLRRNLDSKRFSEEIKDAYLSDYEKLLETRFDEKKYLQQVGFYRTKHFMENLLNEKYQQHLVPTLQILEGVCQKTEQEIYTVKQEIRDNNIEILKGKVQKYVQAFITQVERLLEGSILGDPDLYGQTLSEEKGLCGTRDWPDNEFNFDIQNMRFKLYGGSQYERLLNEFEYVAHSKEFPPPSMNEVASGIGSAKSHNVPIYETAASNIVQIKARRAFQPLIGIVLQRCSYIMKRLFDISTEILKKEDEDKGIAVVALYEQFMAELKATYYGFVDNIEAECKIKLKEDFDAFTKILDWDLFLGMGEPKEYDYLKISREDTISRVNAIMESKNPFTFEGQRSRRIDDETFKSVCMLAGKLFAGVRYFFAKYIRNKLNAFFLDPMFQRLGSNIIDHFFKLPDAKYNDMFQLGVEEMKTLLQKLEVQLEKCKANRDKFRETLKKASASTLEMNEKRAQQFA